MARKQFPGLKTEVYEHPFDHKALVSLERTPVLPLLLKKVNEYGIDKLLRLQTLGSEFKVTQRNFPQLYEPFVEACTILDVAPLPELYLFRGTGYIQSYVIGVENPLIGINLEGMEWLSGEELLFVFGYEVARIKGKYLAYQQIAHVMPALKNLISNTTLGIGGLAINGIEIALYNWIIMAKFTGDRAGLLACQDANIATTALMKLGGLPSEYLNEDTINDFVLQARSFDMQNLDALDKFTKAFSFMEHRLPWNVMRASELLKWVDSGNYDNLIQGKNPTNEQVDTHENDEDWNFLTAWNPSDQS
ncbi:M48 family metallopeptidase [Anabaena subtropica]|uniref:M48 family metallopeptidase n=1 Tax=Anabaena subtropica FACHB-260 TaxID=2692884 RepID=A0ABR8CI84_9NOST|nr:M48 family metallopeptidase [Anabaena subtropica]MBD2342925.1 M48 family metallopeptidase [Anabaena subtropica FACHB-260]